MCPIYKNKEADDIANYRPITILNTDYKILTKAIATHLTEVAPSVIHPDQAGFIRGRSTFNPDQSGCDNDRLYETKRN